MQVAVLSLQGAFAEHENMLRQIGVPYFEIRQKSDLENHFDGLIIPGGESTVQGKLLSELGLLEPLKKKIEMGLPVFGTCAGLILLAKDIANDSRSYIQTMDIKAVRNAYGRQLGSFYTESEFKGIGKIPMTFIRAPFIESVSSNAEILATVNGQIVAAKQDNQLVTAFHPELNDDLSVHRYFLKIIENNCKEIYNTWFYWKAEW